MNRQILVCYKGVTGFTKRYAEWIADEMGCAVMDLKDAASAPFSSYSAIVFCGRCVAGSIDGLSKMKALATSCPDATLIVFAVGATPGTQAETIQKAWKANLTPDELQSVPHFYMPGGLSYEKMPLHEKLIMKAFAAVTKWQVRRKKNKTESDLEYLRTISHSYDLSDKANIAPLLSLLKTMQKKA